MKYTTYSARSKAGRKLIEQILAAITSVERFEYDVILGTEKHMTGLAPRLMSSFYPIEPKSFELHEISPNVFVYVSAGSRCVTRYVCRTYAFDRTDFPPEVTP